MTANAILGLRTPASNLENNLHLLFHSFKEEKNMIHSKACVKQYKVVDCKQQPVDALKHIRNPFEEVN